MSTLIGVQPVVDIITLTLQSAWLTNEANGVSLILISKPESAKTSTIFGFRGLNHVSYYDEITQKKLIDEFLPFVKMGQKKTLLIPDLINCIEKQKSTREQFLNMIKSGIDDTGIVRISTYHKQLSYLKLIEGIKFNFVTATTGESYKGIHNKLIKTGLLSRFVPFTYDYTPTLIREVFNHLKGEPGGSSPVYREIKEEEITIEGDSNLFSDFETLATRIGVKAGGFGFRAQTSFQRLAKSNAALEGRDKVNGEDIRTVTKLANWINFKFNPL